MLKRNNVKIKESKSGVRRTQREKCGERLATHETRQPI
jgi:hypothetical protein